MKITLVKISRISAWLLLFLMILFIITGYSITGKYYMYKLIDPDFADKIHLLFDVPIIILFVIHSGIQVYYAFKRWGWIKKRKEIKKPKKPKKPKK